MDGTVFLTVVHLFIVVIIPACLPAVSIPIPPPHLHFPRRACYPGPYRTPTHAFPLFSYHRHPHLFVTLHCRTTCVICSFAQPFTLLLPPAVPTACTGCCLPDLPLLDVWWFCPTPALPSAILLFSPARVWAGNVPTPRHDSGSFPVLPCHHLRAGALLPPAAC